MNYVGSDKGDGILKVSVGDGSMVWHIETASESDNGALVLSGLTHGSKAIWGDVYWFELYPQRTPALVRCRGDQTLAKVDTADWD